MNTLNIYFLIYQLCINKVVEKYKTELKTEKRLSKGNGNKKSIVVLGCSFAEGIHLSTNETFEAQLSKKTNRTVYNRGYSGFGMAEALWLTKQTLLFMKQLKACSPRTV